MLATWSTPVGTYSSGPTIVLLQHPWAALVLWTFDGWSY